MGRAAVAGRAVPTQRQPVHHDSLWSVCTSIARGSVVSLGEFS